MKKIFPLIFLVFYGLLSFAQDSLQSVKDSIPVSKSIVVTKHSPKAATIMSMVLPGLGQAYNKRYWKIPIIYAGFGAAFYFAHKNDVQYKNYLAEYKSHINDSTHLYVGEDESIVREEISRFRRFRDLSYILGSVMYVFNVVDAAVDAHFFDFDVSDNLSLHIRPLAPVSYRGALVPSVKFNLRF